MKKQIKIRLEDFSVEYNEKNYGWHHLIQLLSEKYDFVYSDNPDFLLYGPLGDNHLRYDCVRIFYTGENIRTDWNVADYGMDFDFLEFGDRHLRLPYFYNHICIQRGEILEAYQRMFKENLAPPSSAKKFCSILVSNDGWNLIDMPRQRFFDVLSRHERVDSGGRWNNNIGMIVGNKIEWLRNYRFHICFENSSYKGYLTEKLFDAFVAGCIPIYWGDTSLYGDGVLPSLMEYGFNRKAFTNAHDYESFEDLAREVMRIHNDEAAYMDMKKQRIFTEDFDPFSFYNKRAFDFLDNIFSQDKEEAKRRGTGQFLAKHEKLLKKAHKLRHISHIPKNFIKDIKRFFNIGR